MVQRLPHEVFGSVKESSIEFVFLEAVRLGIPQVMSSSRITKVTRKILILMSSLTKLTLKHAP